MGGLHSFLNYTGWRLLNSQRAQPKKKGNSRRSLRQQIELASLTEQKSQNKLDDGRRGHEEDQKRNPPPFWTRVRVIVLCRVRACARRRSLSLVVPPLCLMDNSWLSPFLTHPESHTAFPFLTGLQYKERG